MANHFINDETQEFFRKFGIKIGVAGQLAQTGNLFLLSTRVGRRQIIFGFIFANRLGHLEPFGEHEHQRRVDIVDAFAKLLQLFVHVSSPDYHHFGFCPR